MRGGSYNKTGGTMTTQREKLRRNGLIQLLRDKLCISQKVAEKFLDYKQITDINVFFKLGYEDNNKLSDDFWSVFDEITA